MWGPTVQPNTNLATALMSSPREIALAADQRGSFLKTRPKAMGMATGMCKRAMKITIRLKIPSSLLA